MNQCNYGTHTHIIHILISLFLSLMSSLDIIHLCVYIYICLYREGAHHLAQEKKAMEEALDKMVSVKMETQREHDLLLEQLAEAAKGGQVADIKAEEICQK